MKSKTVREIILPYEEGTPAAPSVTAGDKIVRAVEIMVQHDLHRLAVVRSGRPVGMIRLADAFGVLGLEMPMKSGFDQCLKNGS
jgi:CBS domain-containing protein